MLDYMFMTLTKMVKRTNCSTGLKQKHHVFFRNRVDSLRDKIYQLNQPRNETIKIRFVTVLKRKNETLHKCYLFDKK